MALSSPPGGTPVKFNSPRDGRTNRAAMRKSVVLPEPFRPAKITHSPGAMASDTPRNARRPPSAYLYFLNEGPQETISGTSPRNLDGGGLGKQKKTDRNVCPTAGRSAGGVERRQPLASHKVAQDSFRASAFLVVLFFRNCSRLTAQLEPEERVFQCIEAAAHCRVDFR
jgi:hypothetical protein